MPRATHFPSKGRNESVSSGGGGPPPETQQQQPPSLHAPRLWGDPLPDPPQPHRRRAAHQQQKPTARRLHRPSSGGPGRHEATWRLPMGTGDTVACPRAPVPSGTAGWKSLAGTEEFEGWFLCCFFFFFVVVSKRTAGPCSPPPAAPISSLHLHSSGSQGFWQAFQSGFYWFQLSCPFWRVGELQSLKGGKKRKKKKMHHAPCPRSPPFPLPQGLRVGAPCAHPAVPHGPAPRFPNQTRSVHSVRARNFRPQLPPTIPVWL